MHEVSGEDASLASGVQTTAQQVGGAVGLAVLATVALRHARGAMAHGVTAAVASTDGAALALQVGAGLAVAGGLLVAVIRFGGPVRETSPAQIPAEDSAGSGDSVAAASA